HAAPRAVAAAAVDRAHRRTILIVDDDADVRRVLAALLQSAGYRALEAGDSGEALRMAGEQAPDLILMDLVLPGRSALATIQALTADPRTARIPVIIVSAVADGRHINSRTAIIAKPVSPAALLIEIARTLDHHATVLLAQYHHDFRA